MSLEDIVNVTISRETKTVGRAGFSTINVLGIHRVFSELIKFYTSLSSMITDGFLATDKEYIAASDAFAQSPSITRIGISRRATADTAVITVATVANNTVYSVTINGTLFSITSDADATAIEIAAALKIAIDAGSEPVTVTDNLDGTFDIDPTVASTFYSLQTSGNMSISYTTSLDEAVDLANISEADDTWYYLVYTERTQADVEDIADYIETVPKLFITSSADADIIDTTDAADSTTIAAVLKDLSYARSGVFYAANGATEYSDSALGGQILPLDPGSYTGAFKTLASITVDTLTETQKTNALAKNANIYVETGGVNITREATVAEGEYIDIIIFVDWLQARITENVYSLLVNQPKVPYTDKGIAAIEAQIGQILQLGIDRGGISEYTITVPKADDISAGDKAARTLNGITFSATLTGAIHSTTIAGTVQL